MREEKKNEELLLERGWGKGLNLSIKMLQDFLCKVPLIPFSFSQERMSERKNKIS
jgi:hypothetical protein